MNTVQLFQRIGRRARGGDFTKLSLTEQGDIAEAANTAIMTVYNALPAYFREMTEGFILPPPQPITVSVTQYSNIVSSDAFDPSQIGKTVVLDGDPAWNEIIDPSTLLNPYNGPTGVAGGTIYGDAWYSNRYPFDRVIGNPIFADQTLTPLVNTQVLRGSGQPLGWLFRQTIGMPQAWWPQVQGNSQGNDPILVIRFAPAPDRAYSMNIRGSYWPKRLTMADYDNNTVLTVPDQFLETGLMPIALQALMSTPIWDSRPDDANITMRAEKAENYLRLQIGQVAAPSNRIYTPVGY